MSVNTRRVTGQLNGLLLIFTTATFNLKVRINIPVQNDSINTARGVCLRSTVFDTHSAFLETKAGIKKDMFCFRMFYKELKSSVFKVYMTFKDEMNTIYPCHAE